MRWAEVSGRAHGGSLTLAVVTREGDGETGGRGGRGNVYMYSFVPFEFRTISYSDELKLSRKS